MRARCSALLRMQPAARWWRLWGLGERSRLRCGTAVRRDGWASVWGPRLRRPVPGRRRNPDLCYHPIGKPRARRELRQLNQLENDLALALGFNAAERAVGEVHRPGGGEKPLRPQLDFVGSEVHGDVSHWVSYGSVPGLVSLAPIFQITAQFVTGAMDIGFDGPQR